MVSPDDRHAQIMLSRARELAPLRTVEQLRAHLIEVGILKITASNELVWELAYAQARFLMAELADIAEPSDTVPCSDCEGRGGQPDMGGFQPCPSCLASGRLPAPTPGSAVDD